MDKETSSIGRQVIPWLNKHSLALVLFLSLLHVGLAYTHTRDSGRVDPLLIPSTLQL